MLTALTTTLFAAAAMTGLPALPEPVQASDVRLFVNDGGDFRPGDRVNIEVEVGRDGNLVVFRVDGDGYVRVLFPLDPDLDPYVRGDRRYELRGRNDRQTFLADDRGGTGLVLAILSRDPVDFSQFSTGMHWDYDRLRLEDLGGDAEAQLLAIARQMTRNGEFSYDVVGYRVWGPGYESEQPVVVAGGGYDPYWDYSYSCLACGWGYPASGVSITIGNRWGWYDPWHDPWYFRGYRWNGFWGWDPYWGTPYRPITVINPRPRPVVPDTPYGFRSRPRTPGAAIPTSGVPRLTDPVPAPAPVPSGNYDNRSRSRGTAAPAVTPSRREPQRPAATPPSRTTDPVTAPRGGVRSTPPATSTPPASTGNTDRSRTRRPQAQQVSAPARATTPVVTPTRKVEERPVHRPPAVTETPRSRRETSTSRPASSAPPRTVQRPSEPTRVERPAPAPARSAPARSEASGSTQKSSPPASSGGHRSRPRG